MTRTAQIALFVFWPLIASMLLLGAALACAAAWFVIPFGKPTKEDGKWTLKFPWGE
jgi:hypothetical protein